MLTFPKDYDANKEINTLFDDLNLSPSSYPNYGLYHSYDNLINSYPKIIYWEIERQIRYSDAITRRYCLNKNFLFMQKGFITTKISIEKSNTTSIGNLACMAHYNGLNSDWYQLYTKTIDSLKQFHS